MLKTFSILTLGVVLQLATLLYPDSGSAVAAEAGPATQSTSQPISRPACKQQYVTLNKRHEKALKKTPGSRPYAIALYDVEQAIFPALKQCPDNVELVSLMGEVQISSGQIPFAIQYGRKAVKIGPGVWQANYLLGSALNLKKEYDEGIKYLLIASQLAPGRNTLKFNLCSAYTTAKKYNKAIESCTDLINRNDKRLAGPAHYMRALAYKGLGDTSTAGKDQAMARKLGFKEIK